MTDAKSSKITREYGGEKDTTNNRMEMMAIIKALEKVDEGESVTIYSDSMLMVNSFSKWLPAWKKKRWVKKDGKPVMNADLVQKVSGLMDKRTVHYQWVKSHVGIEGNEESDRLARKGRDLYMMGEHEVKVTTPEELLMMVHGRIADLETAEIIVGEIMKMDALERTRALVYLMLGNTSPFIFKELRKTQDDRLDKGRRE